MTDKSQTHKLRGAVSWAAVISCSLLLAARLSHSSGITAQERQKRVWSGQVHEFVRAGLGNSVRLAQKASSADQIHSVVDSVASFIQERSGLVLNQDATERLAGMEGRTLRGQGRRIQADELASLLATAAVERIKYCTDDEIERAADALSNIKVIPLSEEQKAKSSAQETGPDTLDLQRKRAVYVPGGAHGRVNPGEVTEADLTRDKIMLRANGQGVMTRERFISEAKNLRAALSSPTFLGMPTRLVAAAIAEAVGQRVDSFSQAVPDQWGTAPADGLTPLQAFLITYSIAGDDYLWYSRSDLLSMRRRIEQQVSDTVGKACSLEARHAYGAGGYIFSSPLDLAFDNATTERLLDLFEERTSK